MCEPSTWVSTIPTASKSAYIVVGPTNPKPRFLSAFDSATDSGLEVGTYTVVVTASAPVTGAVRAASGFGAGSDFGWFAAADEVTAEPTSTPTV